MSRAARLRVPGEPRLFLGATLAAMAAAVYLHAMVNEFIVVRDEPALLFTGVTGRLVLSAAAAACLSFSAVRWWVHADLPLKQAACILTAHVFNTSGPFIILALFQHAAARLPDQSCLWPGLGCFLLLVGIAAEVTAHFQDEWMYGERSQYSGLNFLFNACLVASFSCTARGMCAELWSSALAAATLALMVAVYLQGHRIWSHSNLKNVVYSVQMISTVHYGVAYWHWSRSGWFILTIVFGIAIIHCTIELRHTGNQWLHVLPSIWSWLSYVGPIAASVLDSAPAPGPGHWLLVSLTSIATLLLTFRLHKLVGACRSGNAALCHIDKDTALIRGVGFIAFFGYLLAAVFTPGFHPRM